MQQREVEKKNHEEGCAEEKNYVLVLYISLHGMVQKPDIYLFTMENVLKAANNSSKIPDLPTGYVNNINLIGNEL